MKDKIILCELSNANEKKQYKSLFSKFNQKENIESNKKSEHHSIKDIITYFEGNQSPYPPAIK